MDGMKWKKKVTQRNTDEGRARRRMKEKLTQSNHILFTYESNGKERHEDKNVFCLPLERALGAARICD